MAGRPAANFRSGDAFFVFDSDLTIVSWNRAAEELTGVSADDAVGRFAGKCSVAMMSVATLSATEAARPHG